MKDLVEHFLVYFFFFSLYPLGSGSLWTFFGSRIQIRILIDADPQHWMLGYPELSFLWAPLIISSFSSTRAWTGCWMMFQREFSPWTSLTMSPPSHLTTEEEKTTHFVCPKLTVVRTEFTIDQAIQHRSLRRIFLQIVEILKFFIKF